MSSADLICLARRWLPGALAVAFVSLPSASRAAALPVLSPQAATNPAAQVFAKPQPAKLAPTPLAFRKPAPGSLSDLRAMENYDKALVAKVSPAVVAVTIGNFGGSAVVISADGLVLSAAHVCGAPGRDVVFNFPDGRTARGKTLGTNHDLDAGLMKITDPGPWPHVSVGDLNNTRLGDWVLALGHPSGFDAQRPTVARLGRIIVLTSRLIQSDCTLLGGDSGGPLFDMSGRVIAIHSRISESTEENFHVPISAFFDSWDRLARSEDWGDEVPYIGIWGVDGNGGFLVQSVDANSPASRAGLKAGDLVIRLNELPIRSVLSYQQALARTHSGAEVTLRLRRDGKEQSVQVTVGARGRRGRGGFGQF